MRLITVFVLLAGASVAAEPRQKWDETCVAALEIARDRAAARDPGLARATVERGEAPALIHLGGSSGDFIEVDIRTANESVQADRPWRVRGRGADCEESSGDSCPDRVEQRLRNGMVAYVTSKKASEAVELFKRAADVCLLSRPE